MKKYKYTGNYTELIGRVCKHCGYTVWTAEEQALADKIGNIKSPVEMILIMKTLNPLELRLFQYWNVAIKAAGDVPTLNDNLMDTLV